MQIIDKDKQEIDYRDIKVGNEYAVSLKVDSIFNASWIDGVVLSDNKKKVIVKSVTHKVGEEVYTVVKCVLQDGEKVLKEE